MLPSALPTYELRQINFVAWLPHRSAAAPINGLISLTLCRNFSFFCIQLTFSVYRQCGLPRTIFIGQNRNRSDIIYAQFEFL